MHKPIRRLRKGGGHRPPAPRRGAWLLLALAGLALWAAPVWAAQSPPAEAPCLAAGRQALLKHDLGQAQRLFEACAQTHPKDGMAAYWLGLAQFVAHEPEKAIASLKRSQQLIPDFPPTLALLGKLYSFDREHVEEARKLLDRALELRPDLEDARFDRARVMAIQGQFDQSFQEFNHLFQSEVRFALYHNELGKILASLGLIPQARQEFERALALSPGFEPALRELKNLENQQGASPAPGQTPAAK